MSPLNIAQPLGINGPFDGYYFWWCPIFPKWDIYQPLSKICASEIIILSHSKLYAIASSSTLALAAGHLQGVGGLKGPNGLVSLAWP